MKAMAILAATTAALVLQAGHVPARAATTVVVYLVIRTTGAEAKALRGPNRSRERSARSGRGRDRDSTRIGYSNSGGSSQRSHRE